MTLLLWVRGILLGALTLVALALLWTVVTSRE
jgi:hypothetical protein